MFRKSFFDAAKATTTLKFKILCNIFTFTKKENDKKGEKKGIYHCINTFVQVGLAEDEGAKDLWKVEGEREDGREPEEGGGSKCGDVLPPPGREWVTDRMT